MSIKTIYIQPSNIQIERGVLCFYLPEKLEQELNIDDGNFWDFVISVNESQKDWILNHRNEVSHGRRLVVFTPDFERNFIERYKTYGYKISIRGVPKFARMLLDKFDGKKLKEKMGFFIISSLTKELSANIKKELAAIKSQNSEWEDIGKLFIPELGTELKLNSDAQVDVMYERRNNAFLQQLGAGHSNWRDKVCHTITIKKEGVMKIDRIYIRKGAEDYSSVTFIYVGDVEYRDKLHTVKTKGRFWINLHNVNKLNVSVKKEKTA